MGHEDRDRDATYVLDIADALLGAWGSREHRFDWLLGDPGASGRRVKLPVDSYWPSHNLVVEVDERQREQPVPHFDKPGRNTVSGVDRARQRMIYDERRRQEIPARGLRLVVVRTSDLACDSNGRLLRDRSHDTAVVLRTLEDADIDLVGMKPSSAIPSAGPAELRTIEDLAIALRAFAGARNWLAFHTPKNLAMAVSGEAGELVAELQWMTDAEIGDGLNSGALRSRVEDEIADVLLYLVRLADVCGIDPIAAARRKLAANEDRYPVAKARGNARKYTDL